MTTINELLNRETLPGCIINLLTNIKLNDQRNHKEQRRILAAFCYETGMRPPIEVNLMKYNPDKYGGDKITCERMRKAGLCTFKDGLCIRAENPVNYYQLQKKTNESKAAIEKAKKELNNKLGE